MIDAEIAPRIRVAILAGDRVALETLLASRSITCCGVFPGKEEEDESEEEPSKDDEEIVGVDRIRRIALLLSAGAAIHASRSRATLLSRRVSEM